MQGGVSQDVAFGHSKLFGQFFKRFGADDIQAFDKWFNKFDVQYNVPDERNINNNFNTVNQEEIEDVKKYILNNQLPSADEAYKYAENGNSYLRTKIEDAREMYSRYDNSIKKIEENYNLKLSKAKTEKQKNKLKNDYELQINKANKMLEDTKQMIINQINDTFENQGTFDESNSNVYHQFNETDKKIEPINIDSDSVPNFEKVSELKKWIEDNLNLIGNVVIKDNSRKVQFSKSNISRSMKRTFKNEVKRNSYAGLKELVENSIYSHFKKSDEKHSKKVEGQEIYYNAFKYNDNIYGIEISIDVPKQNNTPNTFAGHKIKIIKTVPTATRIGSNELTSNRLGTANISINHIKDVFNPKSVYLYNIKEIKNPNIYFQSDILKTVNILKDILSKKDKEKVTEIFDSVTLLKPLKNYFSDVLDDVYFQEMPKWMAEREGSAGGYLEFFNKTVYLNYNKIDSYSNKGQQFIRVLLHELMHAKLENAIRYADKNLNNKQLSEEDKQELQEFLNAINVSKEDIKKYKDFTKKHNIKDVKKDYELVKQHKKAYSYYNNSAIETEVDNVALALQSLLGNSSNRKIRNYGLRAFFNMDLRKESQRGRSELQYIKGFNERYNTLHYGYGRLSNFVNTKTYYQNTPSNNNIVDLTNDFGKSPSINEVKAYINKIVENGTKFATLSPEWFVDVKGGRRTTNKILNAGNYKKLNITQKNRHRKYIMSLEKLLANAEYIGEKENTKKDKKPNIENYHYFKTDVKIGDKTFQILFDTEEYKNQLPLGYAKRNLNGAKADTNIISDNTENFNPKIVHLYNIKEIKNPKTYYQEVNSSDIQENEQLIAGFSYSEVMDKLTSLYEDISKTNEGDKQNSLLAKIHTLENAFEIAEGSDKFKNDEKNHEIMLNAYYIMNNQQIPKGYIEADLNSNRKITTSVILMKSYQRLFLVHFAHTKCKESGITFHAACICYRNTII